MNLFRQIVHSFCLFDWFILPSQIVSMSMVKNCFSYEVFHLSCSHAHEYNQDYLIHFKSLCLKFYFWNLNSPGRHPQLWLLKAREVSTKV